MNIKDFIGKAQARILEKKAHYEKIAQVVMESSEPDVIIDQLSGWTIAHIGTRLDGETLKRPVKSEKNLLAYILKKDIGYNFPVKDELKDDLELAQTYFMIKKSRTPNALITNELLLSTLPDGRKAIDIYCSESEIYFFSFLEVTKKELAIEIIKRGKFSLLAGASIDVLRTKYEGKTILEIMLDNGVIPNLTYVCKKRELFSLGKNNNYLFEIVENDKRVIDYLLERDLPFTFDTTSYGSTPEDTSDLSSIALECCITGQMDKIPSGSEEFYAQRVTGDDALGYCVYDYFKYHNKKNPRIIGKISNHSIIKSLLQTKEGVKSIIEQCDEETLTSHLEGSNVTVISYIIYLLIKKYQDICKSTIMYLEMHNLFTDKICIEFAKYGIYFTPQDKNPTIGVTVPETIDNYLHKEEKYPEHSECADLLQNFRETFKDDSNNQELVELIISTFNRTYLTDPEESIRDIQALIDYKAKVPNFCLTYNSGRGSSFSQTDPLFKTLGIEQESSISIENKYNEDVLFHEWGHVIHEVYGESKTPENIQALLPYDSMHYDVDFLQMSSLIEELNSEIKELISKDQIKKDFDEFITNVVGDLETYKRKVADEYRELLGTDKLILEALKSEKFSREVLDAIAEVTYADADKKDLLSEEKISKYIEARLRSEFELFEKKKIQIIASDFLAYENFLDAYYAGALGTQMTMKLPNFLQLKEPEKLPTSIHGVGYFVSHEVFLEIFADYVQLRKSSGGQKYIEKLKEKTSPELMEALEEYYKNIHLARNQELN